MGEVNGLSAARLQQSSKALPDGSVAKATLAVLRASASGAPPSPTNAPALSSTFRKRS